MLELSMLLNCVLFMKGSFRGQAVLQSKLSLLAVWKDIRISPDRETGVTVG